MTDLIANIPVLGPMSTADFAHWGLSGIAYVKQVTDEDGIAWSIHSADGTQLGISPDRDLAFASIRQHDLEPVSAH